jgi:hypothetical protein
MSHNSTDKSRPDRSDKNLVENSSLYREFLAEREEILRHKWIESEKAGEDIGFERALLDWIVKHRAGWRKDRMHDHLQRPGKRQDLENSASSGEKNR